MKHSKIREAVTPHQLDFKQRSRPKRNLTTAKIFSLRTMRIAICAIGCILGLAVALPSTSLAEQTGQVIGEQVAQKPEMDHAAKGNQAVKADLLVLSKVDRTAIQLVIKLHIASLNQQRADLFQQTFTQKTQDAFDSPNDMLVFFTIRYLPVIFAEDFRFSGLSLDGKVPVQHGYLTDKRGKRWRLSYGLQHLGDGDWRIISSALSLAPGEPT